MTSTSANNKRIAKNTLLLYFRMLFMMAVSLYTSRVVLNALGVEDFGIYNVVGGVVTMFSMLSGSLSAAITRFITYELGTGNQESLKKIFSSAVTIQIGLAILIVLLAEVGGIWFLNIKMNIPEARIAAANWVFQFSILTFAINLISVPYNASIIAHERMSAFAYISILEAVGKLAIAYLIIVSLMDKLVFYAILMCAVALIVRFAYSIYCKRHFEECTYRFIFDKDLLKRMFKFAGWNFIGSSATILRDQGVNIVLNLFCGPVVNAARGIAMQVNNAIAGFVNNFMVALNPQITKSYAMGNKEYMFNLIFQGSRYSYYLLLFLSMPVLVNTDYILLLWLKTVPNYAIVFVQLTLILAMLESLSYPLVTAMLATGNIRKYQLCAGCLNLMNFPFSYLALKLGYSPYATMYIAIVLSIGCLLVRLKLLNNLIHFPSIQFTKDVVIKAFFVTILSLLLPLLLKNYIKEPNFLSLILSISVCFISTSFIIFYCGCNYKERDFVCLIIKNKIFKR